MKKYAAAAAAAILLLTTYGCARYETVDVNSETQAYTRILYNEDETVTDTDDEEIYDEEYDEEMIRDEALAESKEEPKQEEKKSIPEASKDKSNDKKEKSASSETSHRAASSANTSSVHSQNILYPSRTSSNIRSSSSSRITNYKPYTESLAIWRVTSSSLISSSSRSDSSNNYHHEGYKYTTDTLGAFTDKDLTYNAIRDEIDFADSEDFVVSVLGDTRDIVYNEEETQKTLGYRDCNMIFNLDENKNKFFLTDIIVPYESLYVTSRGIQTESSAEDVIATYGQPHEIITVYDESIQQPQEGNPTTNDKSSDANNESSNIQDIDSEITDKQDTESQELPNEEVSDIEDNSSSENTVSDVLSELPDPEPPISHYVYIYKGTTGTLSFIVKDNYVEEIHYSIIQR